MTATILTSDLITIELQKALFAYTYDLEEQGDRVINKIITLVFSNQSTFDDDIQTTAQNYLKMITYIGLHFNRVTKALDQTDQHDYNFNLQNLITLTSELPFHTIESIISNNKSNELSRAELLYESIKHTAEHGDTITYVRSVLLTKLSEVL